MRKSIGIALLVLLSLAAAGQNITGPTTVNVGETHTYTFSNGVIYMSVSWMTGAGTVMSAWRSGATYYASIRWNAPTFTQLTLLDNTFTQRGSIWVNVVLPAPNTTYTIIPNCGSTTIMRNSAPPTGISWFWQTSSTGNSTTLGSASTLNITTTGTYFLRARHDASNTWSSTASSVGTIAVNQPPATPASATDGHAISNSPAQITVSVAAVSGATGYRWYSGGTMISGVTGNSYSPTVNAVSTVYGVEAMNGTCASPARRTVTAYRHPEPQITASNEGIITGGVAVTLSVNNYSYDSYQWINGTSDVAGATGQQLTTNQPGTYRVRVAKGTATGHNSVQTQGVFKGLQGQNRNFVAVHSLLRDGATVSQSADLPAEHKSTSVQYFDGMGRPNQSITWQGSPTRKDVVSTVEYDGLGRQFKTYLPYSEGGSAWLKTEALKSLSTSATNPQDIYRSGKQYLFYQNTNLIAQDQFPYAQTVFEPSPLNRVIEQGSAGAVWQPDATNSYASADRTVKKAYGLNESSEVLKWTYSAPTLTYPFGTLTASAAGTPVFYAAGELTRNRVKDEQGNEVLEYQDREGRVVLKRVQAASGSPSTTDANRDINFASTYYVYDVYGNLVSVIQPEGVRKLATEYFPTTITEQDRQSFLDRWAFRYVIDGAGRMVIKQVPGAGPVFMVYDNRDRLVLTQDANQRTTSRWSFTKYDALNRPVLTGMTVSPNDRVQMQTAVNTFYSTLTASTAWFETYVGNVAGNKHGYDNKSYPQESDEQNYLTATYYDNYNFRSTWVGSYGYVNEGLSEPGQGITYTQPTIENTRVIGQVTGSKVKVLDGGPTGGFTWLRSITYYDDKYRVIQTIADNYKGGSDRTSSVYDFIGKVLKTKSTHSTFTWKDRVAVRQEGNKIIRTAPGNSWGLSGIASEAQLAPGQDGWFEFVIGYGHAMLGVSDQNINAQMNTTDYGFWPAANSSRELQVYQNGNNKISLPVTMYESGDVLRLERTGTTVRYYHNNTLKYTGTLPSTGPLMADIAFSDANAYVVGARSSLATNVKTITRRFEYDHAGRLLRTWHQLDAQPEILLALNEYNELGQLVDKKLHISGQSVPVSPDPQVGQPGVLYNSVINSNAYNTSQSTYIASESITLSPGFHVPTGSTFHAKIGYSASDANARNALTTDAKQSVDYRYNIRGWLTSMNNARLANEAATNDDANDLFGMELGYESTLSGLGNTGLFNGNISGMKYSSYGNGPIKEKGYTYTYDALNRIAGSVYKERTGTVLNTWDTPANNALAETGFTYDLNGNILNLTRNDRRPSGLMDQLAYTYTGNQLLRVTDAGDDFAGFLDGQPGTGNDYTYDPNGNMTRDLNKGIGTSLTDATNLITYNFLNLPETVTKGTNSVRYIYDATGRKLTQVTTFGSQQKQTDYAGEFIYENDALQFINHEEGRIAVAATKMVYTHDGANTTGITAATSTLAPVTLNTQYYIRATAVGTTARQGMFPIGGTITVAAGEQYRIRAKGYRAGSSAVHLLVRANATDINWPGATLPSGSVNEAWAEQIVTIPSGATTLQAGVVWNTVTAGEQFFLNDFEITKLETTTPEYQYHLKDHLGNVRLSFTSKDETVNETATYETANQNTEQSQFVRYQTAKRINSSLFDRTNGAAPGFAQRLNGSTNERYGIAKSISVMPGDVINAEVYVKYVDPVSSNWNSALTTLMGQIAASTAGVVVDGSSYTTSTSSFPYAGLLTTTTTGAPRAYLNWLVFDRNFGFITGGFRQMSSGAKETGTDVAHELLTLPAAITITQPGYVYIYLSNESPTLVDVFFDDFKVTHTKSPVIQAEEYYPFGLVFNSYSRENSVAQDFKFQGQEHQDELGLNWDSFKWRNHQPEIGRFFNVDPLAEKYYYNSPYAFSENHVTSHVELEGLEKVDINALRSSQVREKIKAVNENGRNVIQFSGGAQVAGAGGSLKLGPLSGGGQIQLGAVQGSIKAPGNVEARGALLVASGEASAFGASASGNVALGKASVNVNPDGAGEVIINDGSANGSVSIPSFDSFGPPDRISTGIKDENGSQTASASSNGDVAVKVVLGNAWGEVRANLNAALEVTSNLVGAIGAYVGQVIENIKNPVSSEDQRIIKN